MVSTSYTNQTRLLCTKMSYSPTCEPEIDQKHKKIWFFQEIKCCMAVKQTEHDETCRYKVFHHTSSCLYLYKGRSATRCITSVQFVWFVSILEINSMLQNSYKACIIIFNLMSNKWLKQYKEKWNGSRNNPLLIHSLKARSSWFQNYRYTLKLQY